MGFLVAVLLCKLPEEETFYALCSLMKNHKYQFQHVFCIGMPKGELISSQLS